ncbi:MAG: metal-dependent transcriptional regulator [Methanosarcinaceae archaeon]|nr:metal-dependent transcriptional regulator [Methanosarcinaceae archaeon]
MVTERDEDYLKSIDSIVEKKGYAKVKDVAKELDLGPSTVTGMFKKLSKEGYINYEKYGGATLTPEGKKIASATKEIYGTLKDFLLALGIDEQTAGEDACKIEHILSSKTLGAFERFLEFSKKEGEDSLWGKRLKHFLESGKYIGPELEEKR